MWELAENRLLIIRHKARTVSSPVLAFMLDSQTYSRNSISLVPSLNPGHHPTHDLAFNPSDSSLTQ
jgi:hypothetical protein